MPDPNPTSPKPHRAPTRQWRFLNFVSLIFFAAIFLFFLLILTPLGDPLAASGTQALATARPRHQLVALIESGGNPTIPACPADTVDHMPCEDPTRNRQLSREMNYYRERHCPSPEETPLCLVPPPRGYRVPIQWPESLHKIWHENMPYNKIADRKGHQGWMKRDGDFFIFPGGGTMFPDGAVQYIEKLKRYVPISGGVVRTALDMGCGVASFGGYLLVDDVLTLSFAPRDSHKSQIQFALERGIPAFVLMLGTRRLPFPAFSFDLVHCSRCLVPFTAHDAAYFLEVDRILRPGGYLVISGPPVKWPKQEKEWADLQVVAQSLCYELIVVEGNTVVWKKRADSSCLQAQTGPRLEPCDESDDPNSSWYTKLKKCVSRPSTAAVSVGGIPKWPSRLTEAPPRAADAFGPDTRLWERRVSYYKRSLNLKLGTRAVRNVMDMNAFFGGFAAALVPDPLWVMNVVPARGPPTLAVVYDRGLIGIYHDWCEPFSSYPRTYDFIHVTAIESLVTDPVTGNNRCNIVDVMVEIDRLLRPEGTFVVRGRPETISTVARVARSVRWKSAAHDAEPESNGRERILVATKTLWTTPSSSH